jgi:hypothetical protein
MKQTMSETFLKRLFEFQNILINQIVPNLLLPCCLSIPLKRLARAQRMISTKNIKREKIEKETKKESTKNKKIIKREKFENREAVTVAQVKGVWGEFVSK